jgi:hypothetical protein
MRRTGGREVLKLGLNLVPLQSKFFPAKFSLRILEKEILAGKNLLFKRVNLLCKEGFSIRIYPSNRGHLEILNGNLVGFL